MAVVGGASKKKGACEGIGSGQLGVMWGKRCVGEELLGVSSEICDINIDKFYCILEKDRVF